MEMEEEREGLQLFLLLQWKLLDHLLSAPVPAVRHPLFAPALREGGREGRGGSPGRVSWEGLLGGSPRRVSCCLVIHLLHAVICSIDIDLFRRWTSTPFVVGT